MYLVGKFAGFANGKLLVKYLGSNPELVSDIKYEFIGPASKSSGTIRLQKIGKD